MTLTKLREMTHIYARDTNGYMFTEDIVDMFINQGIDRLRQYPIFKKMKYLEDLNDEPTLLPSEYHYMLALFSASRCFDMDERFYEGTEKRNEFESLLDNLISEIESGNLTITDSEENTVVNGANYIDYIKNVYYNDARDFEDEDPKDVM